LNQNGYIRINKDNSNKDIFIKTPSKYLPTIFDFGLSCFEYKGQIYGDFEFPELGIDPLNSNLAVDFVKLLFQIKLNNQNSDKYNKEVEIKVNQMLKLFLDQPDTTNELLSESYYLLPNLKYFKTYDFEEVVQIIYKDIIKYNLYETNVPLNKILSCEDQPCDNIDQLIYKIYQRKKIESIYDLESLEKTDIKNIDKNLFIDFLKNFDMRIENLSKDLEILLDENEDIYDLYQSRAITIKAVEIKTILKEITESIKIISKLLEVIPKNNQIISILDNINKNYNYIEKVYNDIRNMILRDLLNRKKYIESNVEVTDYSLLFPKTMKKEIDSIIFDILNI
jgi:hypothetical protein